MADDDIQVNVPKTSIRQDAERINELRAFGRWKPDGEDLGPDPNADVIAEMAKNRRINARTATGPRGPSGGGGASISFATARPRDPMFYWQQNNLPYDYTKPGELEKIRAYARIIYTTHPIIGSAIDVFSKYPLTGLELTCKDDALTEFYTELFLEELNYEEYLIDIGREYWSVGEAWPLGTFNETLGVWDDDELMNPDDIEVIRSPFLKEPRFEMALPEVLRTVLQTGQPAWEYEALMTSYPELKNFMGYEARMPVSGVLLKQLKFKGNTFHPRGIPILTRGFRAVMQEEMLNAAQDAIADRLYTPLILAKLGASATDLGTTQPWIPGPGDLADFEEALDAALAGDFRILTHHFAINMSTVFGRENMPHMEADFDRLTDRQLQIFGLSKTMLSGAAQGETYAADAINRDLISQLLSTYQRILQRFFRDRALVVAEAQEHFDYEERGGKRYPVMEEVLEIDEETGEQRIVEQPKLLVPDLHFKAMTMKDEQDQRQFLEALRIEGVPISQKTRLVNVPIDLDEETERTHEEQVAQAIEAQRVRWDTFKALDAEGLPIPDDLEQDFRPKAAQAQEKKAEEVPVATVGTTEPADTMGLAPTPEDIEGQEATTGPAAAEMGTLIQLPRNKARPDESDEQRASMPKPAYVIRRVSMVARLDEEGNQVLDAEGRALADEKVEYVEVTAGDAWEDSDEGFIAEGQGGLISGPSHVGSRRYSKIDKTKPMEAG